MKIEIKKIIIIIQTIIINIKIMKNKTKKKVGKRVAKEAQKSRAQRLKGSASGSS